MKIELTERQVEQIMRKEIQETLESFEAALSRGSVDPGHRKRLEEYVAAAKTLKEFYE